MEFIEISKLHPHPKNTYFFDDIQSEAWDAFLESIRTSGVIEPVIVDARTMTIVSGHQRVRACKELGIEKVLVEQRGYESDDEVIKQLIETNIRQRGIGNANAVKFGRCIRELERIYGVRQGSAGNGGAEEIKFPRKTQTEIAEEIGMTKQQLAKYKSLTDLIPELQDAVQTGRITATTAMGLVKRLSKEEQEQLAEQIADVEKLTGKQVEEYVSKIRELEQQAEERSKLLFELDRRVKDTEAENKTLKADNRTLANRVKPETVYLEPEDYQEVKNSLDKAEDTIEQRDAEIASLKQQLREASNEGNSDFSQTLYEYAVDDMATFISRYSDLAELSGVIGAMKELMA